MNRFDVVCLTENNLHWKNVPIQNRLYERTRGWWADLHQSTAYYQNYVTAEQAQVGGVSVWSMDKAAHRAMEQGKDARGLGRWTWTRYRGRQGRSLRIIAAYRPVRNETGALSAWSQQKAFLQNADIDECPRDVFTKDLAEAIEQWKEQGDQIVLALDVNDNVYNSTFTRAMYQVGLREVCTERHGPGAPPTYNRGSHPIDGIYVSESLLNCRCGYLDFEFDHRGLYVDIQMDQVFGTTVPPTVKRRGRRLKCDDPRIVAKFTKVYREFIVKHQLKLRAKQLDEDTKTGMTQEQAERWEAIDRMRVCGVNLADQHCRKLKTGEAPWSLDFKMARSTVDYWNTLYKYRNEGRGHRYHILRKAKAALITINFGLTMTQIGVHRKEAYREYNRIKKQAPESRKTWLQSLADAKAATGNTSAAQHLENMRRREEQRTNARIIRAVNGKTRSGGITTVIGPDSNGHRMEFHTKSDIEKACLEENERRFNQAKDTPFMVAPLYEHIGPMGAGPGGDAILEGSFICPIGTDPHAVKLMPHLKRPHTVKDRVDLNLTVENHIQGWQKAKEQTATGKSPLHFGHSKAGATDGVIAEFERTMTQIPYRTGYSPQRWQQGIDCMLEKKAGNFNVEKLRAILLFEPDFNQNNKRLGREMMYFAEDLDLLAKEQNGSRKGLRAISQCLNKRLTFDLLRQQRRAGALCSNDAKSCYDRIVHSIASLCMRRVGMPEEPIVCMFTTIQNLKHHIRTAYGDSELYFGGELWTIPVQGVGQGNGAGPQIWAVVSTPVLNMLRAEGHGAFFKAAISGDDISFVGYAFVDDTDLVSTSKTLSPTGKEVSELLQESVDDWEGGIRVTGGAIVPEKSHWYLIDFKWTQDSWKYKTEKEAPAELFVRDTTGQRIKLERLEPSDARRTLGVRLAPDGNQNDQQQFMTQMANSWADRIRTGYLPKHLVWQSLLTTIMKTLEYPLLATSFSEKQCTEITSQLLQVGLSRSAIMRNFPRTLVFAPLEYKGLALPNLWSTQNFSHVVEILKAGVDSEDTTATLLRHSLECMKLEVGLPGPILTQPFKTFGHLATESWIRSTWKFMSENSIEIRDDTANLELQRENDRHIMQVLERTQPAADLLALNRCRIYLQAATLSDITTGDGMAISDDAWKGTRSRSRPTPQYGWPHQGKPNDQAWRKWRRALQKAFGKTLRQNLGQWLKTPCEWNWWFSPSETNLYQQSDNEWKRYPRIPGCPSRNAKHRFASQAIVTEEVPSDMQVATIATSGARIIVTGYAPIICQDTQQDWSLRNNCKRLPPEANWAVKEIHTTDNGRAIAAAIRQGTCKAVSDGSFKEEHGTACWVLEGNTSEHSVYCPLVVPGYNEDHSAYRSELAGIYGIATAVKIICQTHKITSGKVEFACDGIQALERCAEKYHMIQPKQPQFDLIEATRTIMSQSPIDWSSRHVKGHQDNFYGPFDRWAHMNIFCDTVAKIHWTDTQQQQETRPPVMIAGEPWSLWIQGRKVATNLEHKLTDHIHGQRAISYWQKHDKISPQEEHHQIDHAATRRAMKAVSLRRRHWVTKHSAGICGTNSNMKLWKQRESAKCPRCECLVETATHVWLCPATEKPWDLALLSLESWLQARNTAPPITHALITGLSAWHTGNPPPQSTSTFPGMEETIVAQNLIGWQNLFEGFWAVGWEQTQTRHFQWIGRLRKDTGLQRRTGKRWLTAVIQKLWDIAWDLWDHRNQILYDKEQGVALAELHAAIRHQKSLGSRALTIDTRALFRQVLQANFYNKPTPYKEAWLLRITASRNRQFRRRSRDQNTEAQLRQSMRNFLNHGTTNTHP